MLNEEPFGRVLALYVWEGQLISGHGSGRVRVWDVSTGGRRRELEGNAGSVGSLCVVGSRLASGSADGSIKVWAMGPGLEWPSRGERTLTGHTDYVVPLAQWERKLISGSGDRTIRVWELETGVLDATLTGHRGGVRGLLVRGERLFSASVDGSIRAWAVGTWAAVVNVELYNVGASRVRRERTRCAWRRADRSSSADLLGAHLEQIRHSVRGEDMGL